MARQLAVVGLAASAVLAVGSAPSAAVELCGPRTVSIADAGALESGTLSFVVSTSGCAAGTVEYQTVAGTATAPGDYTATSGELSWAVGEIGSRVIVVNLANNMVPESNEAFTVELSDPSGLSIVDDTGQGTIVNDDAYIDVFSSPFCKQDCGICWLRLATSQPVPVSIVVHFATRSGTAFGGSDYVHVSDGIVVIPAGASGADLGVRIIDDTIRETAEQFTVNLFSPSSGLIRSGTATVTIVDA